VCGRNLKALNLCNTHYNQQLRNKKPSCKVDGCDKKWFSVGYCSMHYARYQKYEDHNIVRKTNEGMYKFNGYSVFDRTPQEFLNRKSRRVETGCIEWTAHLTSSGYGKIGYYNYGKMFNFRLAHRLAYFLYYGDFDRELFVCHKCDNPKCINPEHLFLGSHKDNMRDGVNKRLKHKRLKCKHFKVNKDGWYHWHQCPKCGNHAWFESTTLTCEGAKTCARPDDNTHKKPEECEHEAGLVSRHTCTEFKCTKCGEFYR
jgi:predicted RNA-binding Zn-ribbon protein involved in translation (DUF1610 family)